MVKWTVVCCFQKGKHWERTIAPSVGSPAQMRARFEGFEANLPVFIIDDLVYLPCFSTGSSPRKGASSSSSSLSSGRLFGHGTKRSAASVVADGPSTPSRIRTDTPSSSQQPPESAAALSSTVSDTSCSSTQDAALSTRTSSHAGKQRA
jgi:hypothetical protein